MITYHHNGGALVLDRDGLLALDRTQDGQWAFIATESNRTYLGDTLPTPQIIPFEKAGLKKGVYVEDILSNLSIEH